MPPEADAADGHLTEDKITPEVVENMRTWPHSGFSVDQSVFLPAGDRAEVERLVGYMTRCPFRLSRLVKVTDTGQVIYKAEKQACRAFPEADGDGLQPGPRRNFQVLDSLDFLAEFTQHIPRLSISSRLCLTSVGRIKFPIPCTGSDDPCPPVPAGSDVLGK